MKISFDFDDTLTRESVKDLCKELILLNNEIWIVTSRFDDKYAYDKNWIWIPKQNEKLFKVAEELGIPKSRIVFTNKDPKINFLSNKGFVVHFDDSPDELIDILRSGDSCIPINVNHSDWVIHYKEVLKF